MLPNDFWEHEPADITVYIDARRTAKQQEAYLSGYATSAMVMAHLGNAFSKRTIPLPSYDNLFNPEAIPKTTSAYEKRKAEIKAQLMNERRNAIDNG